jgi:DNA-directed RNA polymerase specialized sigma24 family protein
LSRIRDKKRGSHPYTRHTLEFDLPVPAANDRKYPNKAEQKQVILELRALGWIYREIAEEVGLHWTRVGQILRQVNST